MNGFYVAHELGLDAAGLHFLMEGDRKLLELTYHCAAKSGFHLARNNAVILDMQHVRRNIEEKQRRHDDDVYDEPVRKIRRRMGDKVDDLCRDNGQCDDRQSFDKIEK